MRNKWLFIIGVILALALVSMLIAGIARAALGVSSEGYQRVGEGNVALIKIHGAIMTETSSSVWGGTSGVSSSTLSKQLEEIQQDPRIKAVIFEINSPGGSGVATDEILQAIERLNKTTVSYIRDIGASAGYWIAASTDQIFANRLSFVGSIGVIGSYLEFSGFLEDWNITYQRFVGGEYKDFGSPFRQPTDAERAVFQQQIDQVYDIFVQDVAAKRDLPLEHVQELATGMVYTGVMGKELGLIDDIGGRVEAIMYLEQHLNETVTLVEFKRRVSLFDILAGAQAARAYYTGQGFADALLRGANEQRIYI